MVFHLDHHSFALEIHLFIYFFLSHTQLVSFKMRIVFSLTHPRSFTSLTSTSISVFITLTLQTACLLSFRDPAAEHTIIIIIPLIFYFVIFSM